MLIRRRDCFALAALAAAGGCGRKKGTGYPGSALIATGGETSLAVLDLMRFEVRTAIPLGAAPASVLTRGAGKTAFALTPDTGSVHAIAPDLKVAGSRKVADKLTSIQLAGHSVAALAGNELLLLDDRDLAVQRRVPLPAAATAMDVSADGTIAVAFQGGVALLNGREGLRKASLSVTAGAVRFRLDGKLLLVTRPDGHAITALNVPDLQVVADLPLAMEPRHLCFTPDGGQLFITGPGMDGVAIVFPYTLEVEQTILSGRAPGAMACCAQPALLLIASDAVSALTVMNVDTRKMIAVTQVGTDPRFICITPDGQYALVLNEGSGDVGVIRIPAIHRNKERNGAALFTLLPVGQKPVHAAILPYSAAA